MNIHKMPSVTWEVFHDHLQAIAVILLSITTTTRRTTIIIMIMLSGSWFDINIISS